MQIIIIGSLTLGLIVLMALLFYNWLYMYEMKKIEEEMEVRLPKRIENMLLFNTIFSLISTLFVAMLIVIVAA